eukprot:COSAG01_NODE_1928_length_8876_cov_12.801641_4_plen_104_part_00
MAGRHLLCQRREAVVGTFLDALAAQLGRKSTAGDARQRRRQRWVRKRAQDAVGYRAEIRGIAPEVAECVGFAAAKSAPCEIRGEKQAVNSLGRREDRAGMRHR